LRAAGTRHNIRNAGRDSLKLFTIYAPPSIPPGQSTAPRRRHSVRKPPPTRPRNDDPRAWHRDSAGQKILRAKKVVMARYVTSVATPLSATEAFSYMADVTHFVEWDPGVKRVRRVTGDGAGVGAAYDLTVQAAERS